MADIELVISISENIYNLIARGEESRDFVYKSDLMRAILEGTSLPKGHGRLKDVDEFLEKVKKDREHEIYLHSWTADMVLERLDSWYAPIIIEADKAESEE